MRFIYFVSINKKYVTDIMILPLYKTEIISDHRKQTYGYQREKEGRDKLRVWE